MIVGQHVVFIFENKGQVDVIARAPHIPFPVEKPFQTIAHGLAAGVELVGGQGPVAGHFQETGVAIFYRLQIERRAIQLEAGHALFIGKAHAHLLLLVIVGLHHHLGGGLIVVQGGGHHVQGIVLAALGDQAQVGRQEGSGAAGKVVIAVVTVGTGVVLFVPAQVAGITVIIRQPVRLVLFLPWAFVVVRQGCLTGQGIVRAGISDVVAINGQGEMDQTIGMFGHQLGQVQMIALPTVAVGGKLKGFLPQIAASAGIHVTLIQLTALQIIANIVVKHPEGLHLH